MKTMNSRNACPVQRVADPTFDSAVALAADNGLTLTLHEFPEGPAFPQSSGYMLIGTSGGWRIGLLPPGSAGRGKVIHYPPNYGPNLDLPRKWNLLQAVTAATTSDQSVKNLGRKPNHKKKP